MKSVFLFISLIGLTIYFWVSHDSTPSIQVENSPMKTEQETFRHMARFLEKNPQFLVSVKEKKTINRGNASEKAQEPSQISQSLISEIDYLKSAMEEDPDYTADIQQCQTLTSEVQSYLNSNNLLPYHDRETLVELSFSLARLNSQGEAKDVLFQQAKSYLTSSDSSLKTLGRRALQLYMDAEPEQTAKDQRYLQLSQALGKDPLDLE